MTMRFLDMVSERHTATELFVKLVREYRERNIKYPSVDPLPNKDTFVGNFVGYALFVEEGSSSNSVLLIVEDENYLSQKSVNLDRVVDVRCVKITEDISFVVINRRMRDLFMTMKFQYMIKDMISNEVKHFMYKDCPINKNKFVATALFPDRNLMDINRQEKVTT